jgi:hypothetical protein
MVADGKPRKSPSCIPSTKKPKARLKPIKLENAQLGTEGAEGTEIYRLLKLYRAARDGARSPDPGFKDYQVGADKGFKQAFNTVLGLVTVTDLKDHIKPQYTFGYCDGVASALRHWADQLEADRLVSEADED